MGILSKLFRSKKEERPTSSQLIRRTRGQWTQYDKIPEQYDNVELDNGPVFVGNGEWAYNIGELKDAERRAFCEGLNTQTMD